LPTLYAEELTAQEFSAFVGPGTVGVLPVAAIEPHGPHLPLSTDCDIARGHLAELPHFVADQIDVLVLPLQTIGYSAEHTGAAGAFSHEPETLLKVWQDVATTFVRAGGRRLIVVSSHGGNSEVAGLFVQRMRIDLGLLAVTAAWLRFGQPEGLFDETELAYGVHGGAIETSLMLHYWPDAVRLDQRLTFLSAAPAWEGRQLTTHGRTRLGWMGADLNPQGVVGNALEGSAAKGALSAEQALRGFAELIAEVAAFDLGRLYAGDGQ
jgi:creatinine amidohydrolase